MCCSKTNDGLMGSAVLGPTSESGEGRRRQTEKATRRLRRKRTVEHGAGKLSPKHGEELGSAGEGAAGGEVEQ